MTLKMYLWFLVQSFGPNVRTIYQRGKIISCWKGVFIESPKIAKAEPEELQDKSYCGKSLKLDRFLISALVQKIS